MIIDLIRNIPAFLVVDAYQKVLGLITADSVNKLVGKCVQVTLLNSFSRSDLRTLIQEYGRDKFLLVRSSFQV